LRPGLHFHNAAGITPADMDIIARRSPLCLLLPLRLRPHGPLVKVFHAPSPWGLSIPAAHRPGAEGRGGDRRAGAGTRIQSGVLSWPKPALSMVEACPEFGRRGLQRSMVSRETTPLTSVPIVLDSWTPHASIRPSAYASRASARGSACLAGVASSPFGFSPRQKPEPWPEHGPGG